MVEPQQGDKKLRLKVNMPNGQVEDIFVEEGALGIKVLAQMLPLRRKYCLPDDICIFGPDKVAIDMDKALELQHIYDGAVVYIGVLQSAQGDVGNYCITEGGARKPEETAVWEAKARDLKDMATQHLKANDLQQAEELLTAALRWLTPQGLQSELAAVVLANRSLVYMKLELWEALLKDAQECLKLAPDNTRVACRLARAFRRLGQVGAARRTLEDLLNNDPDNKDAALELSALDKETRKSEEESLLSLNAGGGCLPRALQLCLKQHQEGHTLLSVRSEVLPVLDSAAGPPNSIDDDQACALHHALRWQPPLEGFYMAAVKAAIGTAASNRELAFKGGALARQIAWTAAPAMAIVVGVGTGVATAVASSLAEVGDLAKSRTVETSKALAYFCRKAIPKARLCQGLQPLHIPGAIPVEATEPPGQLFFVLPSGVVERMSVDFAETGLMLSIKLLPWKARHKLPDAFEVLRPDGSLLDSSMALRAQGLSDGALLLVRGPALQDDAEEMASLLKDAAAEVAAALPPAPDIILMCDQLSDDLLGGGLVPQLLSAQSLVTQLVRGPVTCIPSRAAAYCTLVELQTPEVDGCLMQSADALRSCEPAGGGWWPIDLDVEVSSGSRCRVAAKPLALCSIDFGAPDAAVILQRQAAAAQTLDFLITCTCSINAVFVHWELDGPGNVRLSTAPQLLSPEATAWSGKRQACFYLGEVMQVAEGSNFSLEVKLADDLCGFKFQPRPQPCASSITMPVWHPNRRSASSVNTRTLPSYFASLTEVRLRPYFAALQKAMANCPQARMLEVGPGPVPILSIYAACRGAQCCAVEVCPALRELAAQAVQQNGCSSCEEARCGQGFVHVWPEATSSISLQPEDLDGMLSPGSAGTDCKVDIVASTLDAGGLSEDYVLTMWHSALCHLSAEGVMIPSGVKIFAVAVDIPLGALMEGNFNGICAEHHTKAIYPGELIPLQQTPTQLAYLSFRQVQGGILNGDAFATGCLKISSSGLLTGLAIWSTPHMGDEEDDGPSADRTSPLSLPRDTVVHFVQSRRKVEAGDMVTITARFIDRRLTVSEACT